MTTYEICVKIPQSVIFLRKRMFFFFQVNQEMLALMLDVTFQILDGTPS